MTKQTLFYDSRQDPFANFEINQDDEVLYVDWEAELRSRAIKYLLTSWIPF